VVGVGNPADIPLLSDRVRTQLRRRKSVIFVHVVFIYLVTPPRGNGQAAPPHGC